MSSSIAAALTARPSSIGGDTRMSTTFLNRLCGLALMVALPLFLAGEFIHPPGEEIRWLVLPTYPIAHILDLGAFLLVLLAMPGFYAHQASRAGRLGREGGRVQPRPARGRGVQDVVGRAEEAGHAPARGGELLAPLREILRLDTARHRSEKRPWVVSTIL